MIGPPNNKKKQIPGSVPVHGKNSSLFLTQVKRAVRPIETGVVAAGTGRDRSQAC